VLLIWRDIAQDNEPAADRFIDRLMRAFQLLGDNPHAGRRDELRAGYRSFPVGEYVLLYQIAPPGVRIMHIVHGRRDLGSYGF
jgi:toxin ParE1/3/4